TTGGLLWHRLRHEYRFLKLRFWKGHYVVCGLGHKGFAFIRSITDVELNSRIVVIDPAPSHELVGACDEAGICIIIADAAEPDTLERARVTYAKEIIAITGSDETNVRIAAEVKRLRKKAADHGQKLMPAVCRVHMSSAYLPQTLQKWTETESDSTTTLRFFDVFDNEARRFLLELPLDGENGIKPDDPTTVHVVVLGMGRMGSALVARAAKMGHFANGKPIRISVVDREANKREKQFYFRYPILAEKKKDVWDLNFYQDEIDSFEIRQWIEKWAIEPNVLLQVFVCLDNNTLSTEFGLRVRDFLKDHRNCNISIRISSRESLYPILQAEDEKSSDKEKQGWLRRVVAFLMRKHKRTAPKKDAKTHVESEHRIRLFGMIEDTCTNETFRNEYNENLARAIHNQHVVNALENQPERKGKPSLAPWDVLIDEFRESNRQQADHISIKMRAIGCRVVDAKDKSADAVFASEEIEVLAELEHRRWNADRWLAGWRKGEPKSEERRISPYLVPWDQLSYDIQGYDRKNVQNIPGWLKNIQPPRKIIRHLESAPVSPSPAVAASQVVTAQE
ncbi:MAG TPA: NAD-binding protein, partial [Tepidisphaeraceae bacterium]|nr:NAD-binding protein [Tepidisphaeraceae bacterium]